MARVESDREDIFAEASALTRRAELLLGGATEPTVFGVKEDGAWSIYFGTAPVFHFDPEGRLKRAFVDGRLYRTQAATLAKLTRERTTNETVLKRSDLTAGERDAFVASVRSRLSELLSAINDDDRVQILRSLPQRFSPFVTLSLLLKATLNLDGDRFLAPRYRGKR